MENQTIPPVAITSEWGHARRLLFRFAFAYFVLYIFPFPISTIPQAESVLKPYEDLWNAVVPRVGKLAVGLEITVRPNGSGDTTYNYVQVFCFLMMSIAVAGIWTLLDRGRTEYRKLHEWLRIYVRFYLATTMITYGAVKVIKSQFPGPTLDRLIQPFGDASPMGLLWTFMGTSQSFNVFTGAGEVIGGLLLTARHTTLLGALVSFGVLSHVAMLNFSYDVPVKLFSLHLLAVSLFLIAPDAQRLANVFLKNRAIEPVQYRPLLGRLWLDRCAVVIRTVLVLLYLGIALKGAQDGRQAYGDLSPRSALYGVWNVEEFEVDGKARPPLVTDDQRWRRVIFDHPKMIAIQLMSDTRRRYALKHDTEQRTLELTKRHDPAFKSRFTYLQPAKDSLELEGTMDGQKIRARLRTTARPDFLLINRGFHWINEYPFNR